MKIAATTILTHQAPTLIEQWDRTTHDADYRQIVVTQGASNEAFLAARATECEILHLRVSPLRYDTVHNAALASLPDDITTVVNLDLDETLSQGWADELRADGAGDVHHYRHVLTADFEGAPVGVALGDRIHSRDGWRWVRPVHERMVFSDGQPFVVELDTLTITRRVDPSRARWQGYLPLLELARREDPHDSEITQLYAKELYRRGQRNRAAAEFIEHLESESAYDPVDRCESFRYLARLEGRRYLKALNWLLRAAAENDGRRAPWSDLAMLHADNGMHLEASGYAQHALSIAEPTEPRTTYHAPIDNYVLDDAALRAIVERGRR